MPIPLLVEVLAPPRAPDSPGSALHGQLIARRSVFQSECRSRLAQLPLVAPRASAPPVFPPEILSLGARPALAFPSVPPFSPMAGTPRPSAYLPRNLSRPSGNILQLLRTVPGAIECSIELPRRLAPLSEYTRRALTGFPSGQVPTALFRSGPPMWPRPGSSPLCAAQALLRSCHPYRDLSTAVRVPSPLVPRRAGFRHASQSESSEVCAPIFFSSSPFPSRATITTPEISNFSFLFAPTRQAPRGVSFPTVASTPVPNRLPY